MFFNVLAMIAVIMIMNGGGGSLCKDVAVGVDCQILIRTSLTPHRHSY
jgi:hypothetical protein